MVLFLSHSDKVIRGRTGPTREPDAQFTPATSLQFRGLGGTDRSLRSVWPTGLPLFATGSASYFAAAGSRGQGGLHRKASPQFNAQGSPAGSTAALLHQS